ncbi:6304_t:CDS:2 [Cetraspora pellucida]|uniref:6304_t:CDS:1 n=1 Tax=Cetraspora pellucida TaxID=1433469 RepID=A0A9N8W7Z4_9GLOM|nr:6304_t:CDS:2 [Cetraspora pellucida]
MTLYSNNWTTVSEENTKPFNKETKKEDEKLVDLVAKYGPKKWKFIAALMKTRNAKQCRERWDSHLKPGIQKAGKNPFTPDEEEIIMESCDKGEKWAKIALKLGNGRTSNDIKNAYNQRLRHKHQKSRMSVQYILNK